MKKFFSIIVILLTITFTPVCIAEPSTDSVDTQVQITEETENQQSTEQSFFKSNKFFALIVILIGVSLYVKTLQLIRKASKNN
ncbi:hypothetical protein GF354_00080 [Candidatus Peregrinibacteria bacterium]|nr:hypothetical protein [Candidatus Peregrinibacteria bacterium]